MPKYRICDKCGGRKSRSKKNPNHVCVTSKNTLMIPFSGSSLFISNDKEK